MNSSIFRSSLAPFLNQFVQYKRALNRKYCADAEVLRLFDRYIQSRAISAFSAIDSSVIDDFLRSRPRRDLQEWEMIPRRLDPIRSFVTPESVLAKIGPNPRIIADDVWARLVWAGLNLAAHDLPRRRYRGENAYPVEMCKALAITWLFAGLRVMRSSACVSGASVGRKRMQPFQELWRHCQEDRFACSTCR